MLRKFPEIEDLPTLVVCGYPNVGKSTFVKNLTGSDVKIADYPFTTQNILVGHANIKYQRYQIIDSPGLLDRAMEKRNKIEMEAVLAIKELADAVLFLVDPGQDVASQVSLLREVSSSFDAPVFVAVNKEDETPKEKMAQVLEEVSGYPVFPSLQTGAQTVSGSSRAYSKALNMPRVRIETYGCSMNRAASEVAAGLLSERGYDVSDDESFDVVVINTCTVKSPTETKILRRLASLAGEGKKAVVMGCLPGNAPRPC